MPSRTLSQYLVLSLKGLAMGAADAVPGVSGGTIAFISGIYEELVNTISNVKPALFTTWRKDGFLAFWSALNGGFLVALLLGILISFASFMRLAKYLIENHPILIWSFFFGLIIASIYYVARQISRWNGRVIVGLISGTLVAYVITTLPSLGTHESSLYLFFAGAVAICAMILPGISGSFILVVLGAYKALSDAVVEFDIKRLVVFTGGAMIGLLSFSHVLKWLFKHYKNTTLALLTGFIIGSLNKVWPWKETISVFSKTEGKIIEFAAVSNTGTLSALQKGTQDFETYKTAFERSVSPYYYSKINQLQDPQILYAVLFAIIGFLTIFILERIAVTKKPS